MRKHDMVETLDHVAVVSEQYETLFLAYEHMGFALTSVARHSGATRPGGPVEPWGIGNRCAMFTQGYLELLAILDPALDCRGFRERVARYEGLHILAFGCRNAKATGAALAAGGVGVQGIGHLERRIRTPDGEDLARFSLVRLTPAEAPECHLNIMQHHSPDLLWQKRYLKHPNGAQSLESVVLCVDNPNEVAGRYARFLSGKVVRKGKRLRFDLPRGALDLVTPEGLTEETGQVAPMVPFVAGFTIGCTSRAETAAVLDANEVAFEDRSDGLHVDPKAGCGAACIFIEL